MAENKKNLTNLGQLRKLAERTKQELDTIGSSVASLKTEIDTKIASTYKPGGTKTAEELVAGLLVAENEGKVYNISTVLTITSANKGLFVEGSESSYPIGTNFVVVNVAEAQAQASYKFDALAGFVDLSGYMEKVASSGAGKLASITSGGAVQASDIDASAVKEALESVEGKADTVEGATDGNLAGLDSDGNLTDSEIAASDVSAALEAIENKADKPSSATEGHLAGLTSDGDLTDSGIVGANVLTKLTGSTKGNLVAAGDGGAIADAGYGVASDEEVEAMISDVFDSED